MRKLNKIKLLVFVVILIFIIIDMGIDKYNTNQIKKIESEYLKTNVHNVFIKKHEKLDLAIINNDKIKKFTNLDVVGEIKNNNPILIGKNGKYGYVEATGKILIPLEYDAIGISNNGQILVKKESKLGLFDKTGKKILPIKYDEILAGYDNNFVLKENNNYVFYDTIDKIDLNVDEIYRINDQLLVFCKKNKFGIMTYKGDIVIPNNFKEISMPKGNIFIGLKDATYSLYDLNNKKVSDDYDFIEQIGNNEFKAGNNETGKYSFLSENISTDNKYNDIRRYNELIYIGELENDESDIINLDTNKINTVKNSSVENYLENFLKREKVND